MDDFSGFNTLFRQLRQSLLTRQQRAILRLAGDRAWAAQLLENAEFSSPEHSLRILSFLEPQSLCAESTLRKNEWRLKHYQKCLGQEYDVVILYAYEGFNLNAFAALSGVLPIGGIYILITPDDKDWQDHEDPEALRFLPEGYSSDDLGKHFITFFISKLMNSETSDTVHTISSDDDIAKITKRLNGEIEQHNQTHASRLQPLNRTEFSPLYKTSEQQTLANQISELLLGSNQNEKSGLLVCADRGRGKSAGIGRALAESFNKFTNNELRVVVTGPAKSSVDTLIQHYNEFRHEASPYLSYQAPDAILDTLEHVDVLIIDEAAAMPVSTVQKTVSLASTSILATTVHGYEGTGRGFEYKLKPWLGSHINDLQHIWLNEPIRWNSDDKLERLLNKSLCLENKNSVSKEQANLDLINTMDLCDIDLVREDKAQLANSNRISEIFGLLSEAHYQTSPNDLRSMLDNPAMEIFTLQMGQAETVVATVLVSFEGGDRLAVESELVDGIWQGRRRPRGHLAPQSLSAHCGYREAVHYQFARIVRIAVAPELQSHGLGSLALTRLERFFIENTSHYKIDFMTTSFGCDQKLLRFWQNQDYQPVRLGLKKETSTGEYSVLMVKPIPEQLTQTLRFWHQRFVETLTLENDFTLRSVSPTLVSQLVLGTDEAYADGFKNKSSVQHKQDIESFAYHHRSADSCYLAFNKFKALLKECGLRLCEAKFVQGQCNAELIRLNALSGEKDLIQKLRDEAQRLYAVID